MSDAQPIPTLEYGSKPKPRRRWVWWIIITSGVVVLGLPVLKFISIDVGLRWGRLQLQRDYMTYSRPPGTTVYAEDPDGVAIIQAAAARGEIGWVQRPGEFITFSAGISGPSWRALYGVRSANTYDVVVFLHERKSPSGMRRLVGITLHRLGISPHDQVWVTFDATAAQPINFFHNRMPAPQPKQILVTSRDAAGPTARFNFGQPDPADASHFTIAYSVDDSPGNIDGWLRDDSSIDLKVRDGPMLDKPAKN